MFIIIALRALRFEPLWVLLAGASAIAGWLFLLAYAVLAAPNGMVVTMDYVRYLTAPSILVSGEVDKIVSIGAVTVILAMALGRAQALLVKASASATAVSDLSHFFDRDVAERITMGENEPMADLVHIHPAAILFVDLRGFTTAARSLEPRELMQLLHEYQAVAVTAIRRHGGSIDKFLGDGILASFGAISPMPDHTAAALRAVDELLAEAKRWADDRRARGLPGPSIGAAVATGEVIVGVVGEGGRLEFTVLGEVVNLAAKLEKHNKAEAAVATTTAEALELARRQGYAGTWEFRANRPVAGVEQPMCLAVRPASPRSGQ